MDENLVLEGVDLQDSVLIIGRKAWKTVGFNFFFSLNEEERSIITEAVNAPDPFFKGKVKDNQVLLYIPRLDPCLDDSDNFSIRWWQEIIGRNNLPLSLQFTDIYNFSYYINRLRVEPGWHLFTANVLPNSIDRTWNEQIQLFRDGYRAPSVHELTTFFVLSYLDGIVLENEEVFGRTVDDYLGIPLKVSQAIFKRITILPEYSKNAQKTVGIYACKKII